MAGVADKHWDYIVVGAGAAGCPLTARISERPGNEVLLLEAGTDYAPGTEPAEILDIFAGTAHSNPKFTWPGLSAAFGPKPSNAYDERPRRRYTQGRVIGGSSSVNGMAANRGLPSDYQAWADQGAESWGWEGVLPYFRKLETDANFDGPMHGKDGPMRLQRYAREHWPGFTRGVMTAIADEGFQDIADQNGVFSDGYFAVAYNHSDTSRIGPAWAYLTREVRARPNLTIRGDTPVERLLFEGMRCIGVLAHIDGEPREIRAREVIVSMGALHSPALMMRSGVGPGDHLRSHGIDVVADRAGVGSNLMEHPGVNFGCFLRRDARLPAHLRRQMFAGLRWSSGVEGCPAGDMYIIPSNKAQWHAIGSRIGLIMMWVNRSFSTGAVRLKSRDWKVAPDIDFNMCSDERDMVRLVNGVRFMVKLQRHQAVQATVDQVFPVSYSDYARKLALFSTWNKFQTDVGAAAMDTAGFLRRLIVDTMIADAPSLDELEHDDLACREWLKDAVHGHWHASCTNRMGRPDDPLAVTSPAGKVYGVEGLRVCDASIMPNVPCANTNIPTVMVGEKVGAMVLEEGGPNP
ncbi:MAG: hypothetical protein RLZ98_1810 [Pseudomonadota bacterium]|jgi:5-(hydroxymethyl)furfural/furfural oxidase